MSEYENWNRKIGRLYAIQSELYPGFAEYQEKTTRVIPVVLSRRVVS
ncbi:MAG: hypothetical protein ACLPUG_16165 [Acidimicrobiales bacterium]|jgi:hypothetical protein